MNKNELDKLIDQGLERLMKKAAIQAEESKYAKARAVLAFGSIVLSFVVIYFINAWGRIVESGDYSRLELGLKSLALITILFILYKLFTYRKSTHTT